jgi:hypothetical protein
VFISSFSGGELFRNGCTYRRGTEVRAAALDAAAGQTAERQNRDLAGDIDRADRRGKSAALASAASAAKTAVRD